VHSPDLNLNSASDNKYLEALRNTVVDVSTISTGLWLTFLLVLLYLVIAAFEVTHRDLFLENPVKLPFLNVDLPLIAFFVLSPALFVVLHAYVLLYFTLLAGKIGNFHRELQKHVRDSGQRSFIRQQLPTSIFVQVLAGPREVRSGLLKSMMRLMAGISLVIAPIALLILFELQFLPYHSERVSWWHRTLVIVDLALLWLFWPSIHSGTLTRLTSFKISSIWATIKGTAIKILARIEFAGNSNTTPLESEGNTEFAKQRMSRNKWTLQARTLMLIGSVITVIFVFKIVTFPGEWLEEKVPSLGLEPLHVLFVAGEFDPGARTAKSFWSNVIVLPEIDVIDHVKFDTESKISNISVTLSLHQRHLEGAILIGAKLRKADFSGVQLQGAKLDGADLREMTALI